MSTGLNALGLNDQKLYSIMIHITNHYHGSDLTAVGSTDNQLFLLRHSSAQTVVRMCSTETQLQLRSAVGWQYCWLKSDCDCTPCYKHVKSSGNWGSKKIITFHLQNVQFPILSPSWNLVVKTTSQPQQVQHFIPGSSAVWQNRGKHQYRNRTSWGWD